MAAGQSAIEGTYAGNGPAIRSRYGDRQCGALRRIKANLKAMVIPGNPLAMNAYQLSPDSQGTQRGGHIRQLSHLGLAAANWRDVIKAESYRVSLIACVV